MQVSLRISLEELEKRERQETDVKLAKRLRVVILAIRATPRRPLRCRWDFHVVSCSVGFIATTTKGLPGWRIDVAIGAAVP